MSKGGWRSERAGVERGGEVAAEERVEGSSASTPHCTVLQGPHGWAERTVTPSFISVVKGSLTFKGYQAVAPGTTY